MSNAAIAAAVRNAAAKARQVNAGTEAEDQVLRDAADLLRAFAGVLEGKDPVKAIGAPGDWGYDTEIGQAVLAMRRSQRAAAACGCREAECESKPGGCRMAEEVKRGPGLGGAA